MAYIKQTWVDGTSVADAERLNHIEDGIYETYEIYDYVGELLWENANPTSDFASQTITLSKNVYDYDKIEIVFDSFTPYKNYVNLFFPVDPTFKIYASHTIVSEGRIYVRYRTGTFASNYTINFSGGGQASPTDDVSVDSRMVPVKIIGYKKMYRS